MSSNQFVQLKLYFVQIMRNYTVCIIDYQVLFFLIPIRAEASLHRLAELNPYVTVAASTQPLHSSSDLSFLRAFQVPLC